MTSQRTLFFFSFLFSLLSIGGALGTPSLGEAEVLFKSEKYSEAKSLYEAVIQIGGESRWQAQYRKAECEAALHRYQEAAQFVSNLKLPPSGLWRARLLFLQTQIYEQYLLQFGWRNPEEAVARTGDITQRSGADWEREIQKTYLSLWPERELLGHVTLASESAYLQVKEIDADKFASFWSLIAHRWANFILTRTTSPVAPFPNAMPIKLDLKKAMGANVTRADKIGGLYETVAELNPATKELWNVERWALPLSHPELFSKPPQKMALFLKSLLERNQSLSSKRAKARLGALLATAFDAQREPEKSVSLCHQVEKWDPRSESSQACLNLRSRLEQPEINFTTRPLLPGIEQKVPVISRNTETLFFRWLPISWEQLNSQKSATQDNGFYFLKSLDNELLTALLKQKPTASWSVKPHYPKRYRASTHSTSIPASKSGFYVLLVADNSAFSTENGIIRGALVRVSQTTLLGSAAPMANTSLSAGPFQTNALGGFHIYAVDSNTGAPLAGLNVEALQRTNWQKSEKREQTTDRQGHANFAKLPSTFQSLSLDPLVKKDSNYALLESPLNLYQGEEEKILLLLDLDRPVYRQGQTVHFKVTAFERGYPGWKWRSKKDTLNLIARNASGKVFFDTKLELTDKASLSGDFTIPEQGMMGSYSLEVRLTQNNRTISQSRVFSVEAYQRPELELVWEKAQGPCRFQKSCSVQGKAITYSGTALAGRTVTYRISRQPYFFFWEYWRSPSLQAHQEVAFGSVVTAQDGLFSIPFIPQPYEDFQGPAKFLVTLETRELGGRTITAQKEFLAGEKAFQIRAESTLGFFSENEPAQFEVSLEGLNGEKNAGQIDYSLYTIKAPPHSLSKKGNNSDEGGEEEDAPASPPRTQSSSLESWLDQATNDKLVLEGRIKTDASTTPLLLKPVPPGIYRLTLAAKDTWGGVTESKRMIVVTSSTGALVTPMKPQEMTLALKKEVTVGSTIDVLLGSGEGSGPNFVELWQGKNLIALSRLGSGIQKYSVNVEEKHRGGVTVRWFSLWANQLYQGALSIDVPWSNKVLSLKGTLPSLTEPGKEIDLTLEAQEASKKPIEGEGILRVTDRALEYYAQNEKLGSATLFPSESGPEAWRNSQFFAQPSWFPASAGWLEKRLGIRPQSQLIRERREPRFSFEEGREQIGSSSFGGHLPRMRGARGNEEMQMMADSEGGTAQNTAAPMAKAAVQAATPQAPAPVIRKDFSETAAFVPHLEFSNGRAQTKIRFPDSLTSWKAEVFVTTADGKVGYLSNNTTSQRPLMVELAQSRFLREGDKAQFRAILYNNTDASIKGTATFRLQRFLGESKAIQQNHWPVELMPHSQQSVPIPVDGSLTIGDYQLELLFKSGSFSDGVRKEISVLPSRQVLVASQVALLEGDKKVTLSTQKLPKDSTLKSSTLAIDPNLIVSVLSALPRLSTPPAFCLDALLNRYVPLEAVKKLFVDFPEIRKVADAIGANQEPRQAWDLKDPRRLLSALESPWALDAEGSASSQGADLLNPKIVEELSLATRKEIPTFQKEDGAFSWFPGGPSDLYMTLTALATFVEGEDLGVPFDISVQKKAAAYVINKLHDREKNSELRLTSKLYAAFVIAALSEKYEWAKNYHATVSGWLGEAEKFRAMLTPLGRAYAARAYFHIGNKTKADEHLGRLLSDAVDDPIAGLSWKLEELSWLWYHDSLEKHLFVLRTLLKVKPTDPKIGSLIRGLFWQKKGNQWKSPRHSAQAIFAMVTYLRQQGAFTKPVQATWNWAGKSGEKNWAPLDANESALIITEKDPSAASLTAQVDKKGAGLMVASLTTLFETGKVDENQGQLLDLKRVFYRREKKKGQDVLHPLKTGDSVTVGDIVEEEITLKSRSQFEYLHLKSPRGAGFEPEEKISGWKWDGVSRYQEIRDSLDQIFISWMPNGTYRFRFPLRASTVGKFHLQSALVQSLYSPDVSAYTGSTELTVKEAVK